MNSVRRVTFLPLLEALSMACPGQSGDTRSPFRMRQAAVVPPLPPDSVPGRIWAEIHAPRNIIPSSPHWGVPFPRDLILVMFKDNATPAQRQSAIHAVRGQVVGGEPIGQGGYYYVRIPGATTGEALFKAIAKLETLSQVDLASPELPPISPLDDPHRRKDPRGDKTERRSPLF